jgi:hypothetical protein
VLCREWGRTPVRALPVNILYNIFLESTKPQL